MRGRTNKTEDHLLFCYLFPTAFGPVAILWSAFEAKPKILRVLLSKPELSAEQILKASFPEVVPNSSAEIDLIARQISAFLSGCDIRFSLDISRIDLRPAFQRRVLLAESGIPRGQVSTYQRIAGYLGNANGARAVGTALANNPFPVLIPCHRAIRTDMTLGGFQGGIKMKRALLEMEGIRFNDGGQVMTERIFY